MPLDLCALTSIADAVPDPSDVQRDRMSTDPVALMPVDFAACLSDLARRNLNAIAADLDQAATDPQACGRRARALATVTLARDEIQRVRNQHASAREPAAWVVDDDDPRACPRDPHELRTTLAAVLDRMGEKKNISFS